MPTVDTTTQNTTAMARDERIRLRAEDIYRRRGNRPGSAMDDGSSPKRRFMRKKSVQLTKPRKNLSQ